MLQVKPALSQKELVLLERIIEKLVQNKNRQSTKNNYLGIWRQFNRFIMRLDVVPNSWEQRVILFCAFLVQNGLKSSTITYLPSKLYCRMTSMNGKKTKH